MLSLIDNKLCKEFNNFRLKEHLRAPVSKGFAINCTKEGFVVTAISGERLHATYAVAQQYTEQDPGADVSNVRIDPAMSAIEQASIKAAAFIASANEWTKAVHSQRQGPYAQTKKFNVVAYFDVANKEGVLSAVVHIPVTVSDDEKLEFSNDLPAIALSSASRSHLNNARDLAHVLDSAAGFFVDFEPTKHLAANAFSWCDAARQRYAA